MAYCCWIRDYSCYWYLYSLKNLEEELLTKVDKYLSNPNELKRGTEAGRDFVLKNHTWQKRAEEILNYIQLTFI